MQHIFSGEGAPNSVEPNNEGDHYTDRLDMVPYVAVGDGFEFSWARLATVVFDQYPPGPKPGAMWISPAEASQQGVGYSNGAAWKKLATIDVGDSMPSAAGREPGFYLNNQTGELGICDGLGGWFVVPTTFVE